MAMSLLTAWSWPGNIRELSNVIERAVVMNSGPIIFSEDLPPQIRQPVCNAGEAKTAPVGERNLKEEIKRVEKRIIMEVLEQQEGNRTRTALMLGISRRALMYKPRIRYRSGGCITPKLAMQIFAQCAIFCIAAHSPYKSSSNLSLHIQLVK